MFALIDGNSFYASCERVFRPELDPAFIDCPNLIVTPHIASGTVEARRDSAAQVLENITAFIEGKNPPCRVI